MEMRTGKTPVTLNEFLLYENANVCKNAFIIAPNQFKEVWASECDKFGMINPVHVFHSSRRDRARAFVRNHRHGGILITNYESLLSTSNLEIFESWVGPDTYVAADESASIKNPQSARFKAIMTLTKECDITRVLSGLPAPQAPYDLWAQLRFIGELSGFRFHPFKHKFTVMGGWRNKQPKGARNESELNNILYRCSFRARRGDWSEKLDSDYEVVPVALTPEQQEHYATMENDMIILLENDMITVDMAISKVMKLQQICSGFVIREHKTYDLMPFDKTSKFEDLHYRLTHMIQGKTIIVAHYKSTVRGLMRELAKFKPAMIAGSEMMREYERDAQTETLKFNQNPACRVMVAQGQAVKYGFTLMGNDADPCHTLVFYENTYSLDTRAQCEERPQGVGQTAPIHILDYAGSRIELDIVEALQRKRDIAETIMGYVKGSASEAA